MSTDGVLISNVKLVQAMKASQIRRNENAEGNRRRKYARDVFKKYFSFSGNSAGKTIEQNEDPTSL
tara:strand:- start:733 stop:930 length:198 start_codon:yes stop_codon:yes gene_type:complete